MSTIPCYLIFPNHFNNSCWTSSTISGPLPPFRLNGNMPLTPLPKPNQDPSSLSSYRPISLLDSLSKVMTRLVSSRLRTYLTNNNILSPRQSGFRARHSTVDILIRLVSSICQSLSEDSFAIALFLDIQKAYDTVWHDGLLYKLTNNLLYWVGNSVSQPLPLQRGVPKGIHFPVTSSSSSSNLPLTSDSTDFGCFADDPSIWSSHSLPPILFARMQAILNSCERYGNQWQLKFSPTKTCFTFSPTRATYPTSLCPSTGPPSLIAPLPKCWVSLWTKN